MIMAQIVFIPHLLCMLSDTVYTYGIVYPHYGINGALRREIKPSVVDTLKV